MPRGPLTAPLLALALAACASAPRPVVMSPTAAVYAAAFRAALGPNRTGAVRVEEPAARFTLPTLSPNTWPRFRREMAVMPEGLVAQLAAAGDSGRSVRAFGLPPDTQIIPQAESLRLQAAGLGGGTSVLGVSSVAFSVDSAQAVVYVERHCGALCGDGTVYLFVRDARGHWAPASELILWQG